jgi:hypothetical protein
LAAITAQQVDLPTPPFEDANERFKINSCTKGAGEKDLCKSYFGQTGTYPDQQLRNHAKPQRRKPASQQVTTCRPRQVSKSIFAYDHRTGPAKAKWLKSCDNGFPECDLP